MIRKAIRRASRKIAKALQDALARAWFCDVSDAQAWVDEQVDPPPFGDES